MATTGLPNDFKEFLRLLRSNGVEYLIVGGYAVAFHGFPRATGDMDVWIRRTPENAARIVATLNQFGFDTPELTADLFLQVDKNIRMGVPPVRIEILTGISGVDFDSCYPSRVLDQSDGLEVSFIGRDDLLKNKRAAARHKDLDDLEKLGPGGT